MHARRLVLGTAQLGMPYGIARRRAAPDRARAFAILETAADLGIERLDTAPAYGQAETWIGDFLARHPGSFALTSKLDALPPGLPAEDLPAHVEQAVTASLARLRTPRIDRYLVHAPRDLARFGPRLIAALDSELGRGRIGRLGVSAYTVEEARALLDYPELTLLQHPLSLLDRRLPTHAVFADLKAHGIEIEARSVLLQGLLALAPNDPVARRLGASAALAALGRCLGEYAVGVSEIAVPFVFAAGADTALIGVESAEQLTALCSTASTALDPGLLAAIDALEAPIDLIDPRRWPT